MNANIIQALNEFFKTYEQGYTKKDLINLIKDTYDKCKDKKRQPTKYQLFVKEQKQLLSDKEFANDKARMTEIRLLWKQHKESNKSTEFIKDSNEHLEGLAEDLQDDKNESNKTLNKDNEDVKEESKEDKKKPKKTLNKETEDVREDKKKSKKTLNNVCGDSNENKKKPKKLVKKANEESTEDSS